MLGHYTRVEYTMEKGGNDIIDIAMTDKQVILYNNKYFRLQGNVTTCAVINQLWARLLIIYKKISLNKLQICHWLIAQIVEWVILDPRIRGSNHAKIHH